MDAREHIKMEKRLKEKGLENRFPRLHHFSRKSPPRMITLDSFSQYCRAKSTLRENGGNPQTIRRVMAYLEQLDAGVPDEQALHAAWQAHPLRK